MIDRVRVDWVTYTRCSDDLTNKHRGHIYLCPSEPCTECVIVFLVEVRIKLPHYSFHHRAVILYHVGPPLGIQQCPYPWCALIELLYHGPPLYDDPAPVIVADVSTPNLILLEMGVVIYQLGILLICGDIGLSDRLIRDWPVSSGEWINCQ
jgi:hypothetical protein